jgi:O-methyltransferase
MNQEWFEQVCLSALGHRTSQEETYDLARVVLARGIPGDFIECGVFAGASCAIMARAIMDHWEATHGDGANTTSDRGQFLRESPRVHLFDSFDGIPTPGPHDDPSQVREGEARCSLANVKANMRKWGIPDELLVYHQGDFRQTVPAAVQSTNSALLGPIAFLRLDGDLYESTRVCMEHLYPLVSKGGYIICDDYDLVGCRYALHQTVMPAPIAWRKWT